MTDEVDPKSSLGRQREADSIAGQTKEAADAIRARAAWVRRGCGPD